MSGRRRLLIAVDPTTRSAIAIEPQQPSPLDSSLSDTVCRSARRSACRSGRSAARQPPAAITSPPLLPGIFLTKAEKFPSFRNRLVHDHEQLRLLTQHVLLVRGPPAQNAWERTQRSLRASTSTAPDTL